MLMTSRIRIFAALWSFVGFIHALLAFSSVESMWNEITVLFLIGFTILIFPIRSFLLEKILDLRFENWGRTTAKGAARGFAAAFCAAIAVALVKSFIVTGYSGFSIEFLAAYVAFRLAVIWWQSRQIQNLNRNWLYFNIVSVGLYSLVSGILLPSPLLSYGEITMQFLGVVISELAVSFAYINLKLNEDEQEKRKVEEM